MVKAPGILVFMASGIGWLAGRIAACDSTRDKAPCWELPQAAIL
jgi:hypothetical protein